MPNSVLTCYLNAGGCCARPAWWPSVKVTGRMLLHQDVLYVLLCLVCRGIEIQVYASNKTHLVEQHTLIVHVCALRFSGAHVTHLCAYRHTSCAHVFMH